MEAKGFRYKHIGINSVAEPFGLHVSPSPVSRNDGGLEAAATDTPVPAVRSDVPAARPSLPAPRAGSNS
jgi:hypothetical protein